MLESNTKHTLKYRWVTISLMSKLFTSLYLYVIQVSSDEIILKFIYLFAQEIYLLSSIFEERYWWIYEDPFYHLAQFHDFSLSLNFFIYTHIYIYIYIYMRFQINRWMLNMLGYRLTLVNSWIIYWPQLINLIIQID